MIVYPIDKNNVWTGETVQQSERGAIQGVFDAPPKLINGQYAVRFGKKWLVMNNYPYPAVSGNTVPRIVTMRQARLALLQQGLLSSVEVVIAGLPEPEKSAALIEWEYATTVDRDWPWVVTLTELMGLTDEQIDELFILANTL